VSSEDSAYSTGYIAAEIEGKIEISHLEIYGLGGEKALEL
jgi:hypothetical protein